MNKLTKHQLQHIEQFLIEHYRLFYIDIRAEVLDHIAADIEAELFNSKTYEEAFVSVIAKWDPLLKPAKSIFRGIPHFIAKQWVKERFNRGGKACLFGILTTLLFASLFHRFVDLDENFLIGLGILGIIFISCGIVYLRNYSLVKKAPLYTAAGTFLRIEFKRLVLIQSTFVVMALLSQLKVIPNGDWFFYTYVLLGCVTLFYMIHWRMDYQKEKLYQIKWKAV